MTPLVRFLVLLVGGVAMTSSHILFDWSSSPTLLKMSDIERIVQVQDQIDEITSHSDMAGEDIDEAKQKIKELAFGMQNIIDYLEQFRYECQKGVLYKGKLCLFYSLDFIEATDRALSQEDAQQKCLSHGGTLFRPPFDDPNLLQDVNAAFPELLVNTVSYPFVDGTEISGGSLSGRFEFSNGCLIPDGLVEAFPSVANAEGVVLVYDGATPYLLEEGRVTPNEYICQFPAVYTTPIAGSPPLTGDDFIDLTPNEEELAHLTLQKIHEEWIKNRRTL